MYRLRKCIFSNNNKFRQELEKEGFEFNPYDPCVGNRTKNRSQHTIQFHVDDVMSSHINPKVNDNFDEWLQAKYGEHGKVKAHRGKVHDYLRIIFEYEDEGKVKVDMSSYMKNMLDDFPIKLRRVKRQPRLWVKAYITLDKAGS